MTKPRSSFNWEFWIPAVGLGALALWLLVIPSLLNIRDQWKASSWSETVGRVTVSETYKVIVEERTETRWRFKYQYRVEGKEYENVRYSFRYASGEKRLGFENFRKGQDLTVYFDPSAPSRSVINRSLSPWWNYLTLFLLVFVPIAAVIRWKRVMSSGQSK